MRLITIAAGLLGLSMLSAGIASAETRELSIRQGLTAERASTVDTPQFKADDDALPLKSADGNRSARKAPSADMQALNGDFWIFDATAIIRDDFDGDGFFTRLEVTFDADTVFNTADVYAVLYLSLEGGDWIEYGSTDTFRINGSSAFDEYFFDSDLVSGFPTGYYDVLIDLYDTFDNSLVATFGPDDSGELFDLPLESQNLDSAQPPVVVISNEGGGGSFGLALLALFGGLIGWRKAQ